MRLSKAGLPSELQGIFSIKEDIKIKIDAKWEAGEAGTTIGEGRKNFKIFWQITEFFIHISSYLKKVSLFNEGNMCFIAFNHNRINKFYII